MKRFISIILTILIVSQSFVSLSFATEQTEDTVQTVTEGSTTDENVFVPMELSSFGLEMIKSFEGFNEFAYWDYSQWTIGYGTSCGENEYPNGITEIEATALMKSRMPKYVNAVNNFIKNYGITLNQNQFDALVSLSYNCGQYIWNQSLDDFAVKKVLIEGNWTEAKITDAFLKRVTAGGQILDALVARRTREAKLFNSSINLQDPALKYYFVSVDSSELNVRPTASTAQKPIGSIENTVIIPVTQISGNGKWAYTPYGAYFGWVSTSYIIPLEEAVVLGSDMIDGQGVKYTYGTSYKTIIAGVPGADKGSALYDGLGDGNVYLGRYIKSGDYVYQLSAIADGAFYGNTHLKTIYIPNTVKSIAENAFTNSSLEMIYCSATSYAATYAESHGIPHMEYACRNGHKYDNAIWKVIREVNCTQDGLEGLCCDNCGFVSESRVYKTKLGHSYSSDKKTVSELSCTTDYVVGKICSNCGDASETEIVQKSPGHAYEAGKFVTVTPTLCTTDGLEAIICSVCQVHVEERVVTAPGHTSGAWETISTVSCTTDGVMIKRCTVCAEMVNESITPARHTYDENNWQTVTEPTCTKKGESAVLCVACSAKVKTQAIAAKGHNYGEWYTKTESTYLKKGTLRRDCDRCTSYETKSIAVLKTEIVTESLKLNSSLKTVEGIVVETKASDILAKIENSHDVRIIDKNGNTLSPDDFVGTGSTLVLFEGNKTLLSYSFTIKGDADGDGLASDWDCILLGRYLAGWEVDIFTEALDFDKNGVVNDWDEILFSRYLASWDVKLW